MPYADPQQKKEYERQYYLDNREKKSEQGKDRYHANVELSRAKNSLQYDKHKDKKLASKKTYRENNAEKIRQLNKGWRKANARKVMLTARLRAQYLTSVDELLSGEWEAVVEACGDMCIVPGCDIGPVTMDHVVPLSKGGRHHISNLQPLCAACNSSKGIKDTDYRGA